MHFFVGQWKHYIFSSDQTGIVQQTHNLMFTMTYTCICACESVCMRVYACEWVSVYICMYVWCVSVHVWHVCDRCGCVCVSTFTSWGKPSLRSLYCEWRRQLCKDRDCWAQVLELERVAWQWRQGGGRWDQRGMQVWITWGPAGHGKDFDFELGGMGHCWRILISKVILYSDLHLQQFSLAFVGRLARKQEGQLETCWNRSVGTRRRMSADSGGRVESALYQGGRWPCRWIGGEERGKDTNKRLGLGFGLWRMSSVVPLSNMENTEEGLVCGWKVAEIKTLAMLTLGRTLPLPFSFFSSPSLPSFLSLPFPPFSPSFPHSLSCCLFLFISPSLPWRPKHLY